MGVRMSLRTRREYLKGVRERYAKAHVRSEKSQIVDEVVRVLNYHRKYAIQALNDSRSPRAPAKRTRSLEYSEALPAIKLVWEALDYPCAERLHPVLLPTADLLSSHDELVLTPEIRLQLAGVSQSTLARRLSKWRLLRPRCTVPHRKQGFLLSQVPMERYEWDESRPGAIEIDLVEHNGGSSWVTTVSIHPKLSSGLTGSTSLLTCTQPLPAHEESRSQAALRASRLQEVRHGVHAISTPAQDRNGPTKR
jgi:uncharacterized protein YnzC (UPF0291/DUF896 family)